MNTRFDICEAYYLLESDYNVSGILQERKSNTRRNMSTVYQLNRMNFTPKPNLSYDTLTENGKRIYDTLEIQYGFKSFGFFDPKDLKESLEFAKKALATTDNRPVLTCAYLEFGNGTCTITGANGFVLHTSEIRYTGTLPKHNVLLTKSDVSELASMIRTSGAVVEMTYGDYEVKFSQYYKGKTTQHTFTPYAGTYPLWQSIVPDTNRYNQCAIMLSYSGVTMLQACFSVFNGVRMVSDGINPLEATGYNPTICEYKTTMHLPVTYKGVKFEFAINPQFVYNAAPKNKSIMLVINLNDPHDPFVIEYDNKKAIIMPIRIIE